MRCHLFLWNHIHPTTSLSHAPMIKTLRKKEMQPRSYTYPFLGPSGFVQLHYTEWGPHESERTVLCVHGLTRNGRDFDFLARHLAHQGMRVIAPDLPGRGRSEWLPSVNDYATATYLAAMTSLVCRLNVPEVDWVGTSLGGHIGMEFAARLGAPVRRLVLNDFGARLQGGALNRLGRYARMAKQFSNMEDLEQHLRTVYRPFGELTDEQWRHMTEHSAMRNSEGYYRQNFDPAISVDFMLWPALIDITPWHAWEKMQCPVLILRCETSDMLLTSTVDRMKERGIAASHGLVESVEIPNCGHAPALMSLEQVQLVEEFLTRDDMHAAAKQASAFR